MTQTASMFQSPPSQYKSYTVEVNCLSVRAQNSKAINFSLFHLNHIFSPTLQWFQSLCLNSKLQLYIYRHKTLRFRPATAALAFKTGNIHRLFNLELLAKYIERPALETVVKLSCHCSPSKILIDFRSGYNLSC